MTASGAFLNGNTPFVWDSETHMIVPGLLAPMLVCVSYTLDGQEAGLLDRDHGIELLAETLEEDDIHYIGHNIAYDFTVLAARRPDLLEAIFEAYASERVSDTQIREKLIRLALGEMSTDFSSGAKRQTKFSMGAIFKNRFAIDLSEDKGPDAWRTRYAELDGIPIDQWPPKAAEYARSDATRTHLMFMAQAKDSHSGVVDEVSGFVTNEFETAAAAFALHLAGAWGVRTDAKAVSDLAEKLAENVREVRDALTGDPIGIFRAKDGTKDTKRLKEYITTAYDGAPPATAKGGISTDKETLMESDPAKQPHVMVKGVSVPILHALASISADEHNRTTYIPAFSHGTIYPINCGWNSLVESGRTSAWGPNWQNLPTEGGFRECVIPRQGNFFINADYSGIEMCALAQVCLDLFGHSTMAEALVAGKDLHLFFGAAILGITYAECVARYEADDPEVVTIRKVAKHCNFGLGGGMGAETFVATVWKQSGFTVRIPVEGPRGAWVLKALWLDTFPELREFFAYVSQATSTSGGETTFVQPRSGRVRGGCGYCDGLNTHFQGLAADGAKAAFFFAQQECYTGYSRFWTRHEHGERKSPLYGARITIFVHDELIGEAPEHMAAEAAERMSVVMGLGMGLYITDVPIIAKPLLMRRWYKKAKPVHDSAGRLVPWEPEAKTQQKGAA